MKKIFFKGLLMVLLMGAAMAFTSCEEEVTEATASDEYSSLLGDWEGELSGMTITYTFTAEAVVMSYTYGTSTMEHSYTISSDMVLSTNEDGYSQLDFTVISESSNTESEKTIVIIDEDNITYSAGSYGDIELTRAD